MPNRFGEIRGAAGWFIRASALIAPPGCLGTRQRGSPHRLLAMRLFRLLSDDSISAGAAVVTRGLVRNQGKTRLQSHRSRGFRCKEPIAARMTFVTASGWEISVR
ncbi:MAG: hypothetical protein QOJ19_1440 [Acidimicrobiia bacterium]|nr:hypothetical protein [Acidimicrobiia bacterium]